MDKLACFIIVNHNASAIIGECIESILNQTYGNQRILIMDNHSSDHSCETVAAKYPQVTMIRLEKNYGFAKANNMAIQMVLKENPDFIALVNSDVVLDERWLDSLIRFMDDQQYDLAQSVMIKYESKNVIDTTGIAISPDLQIVDRDHGRLLDESGQDRTIFGPCFAASLFKVEVMKRLMKEDKFFNEEFVNFYEDVDCCFRANLEGFKAGLNYRPLCRHRRSFTADKKPFGKYYYIGRNYFLVLGTYFPFRTLLKNVRRIIWRRGIFLLKTARHPNYFLAFLAGSLAGAVKAQKKIFSADRKKPYRGVAANGILNKIEEGYFG